MTKQPIFTLRMLRRACEPGAAEASQLFRRGKEYTIGETVKAGASRENIVWLLFHRADADPIALKFMQEWARRSCAAYDVPLPKMKTGLECYNAVKNGMRARNKALGTSRGGKDWAYGQLLKLIEDTDNGAR